MNAIDKEKVRKRGDGEEKDEDPIEKLLGEAQAAFTAGVAKILEASRHPGAPPTMTGDLVDYGEKAANCVGALLTRLRTELHEVRREKGLFVRIAGVAGLVEVAYVTASHVVTINGDRYWRRKRGYSSAGVELKRSWTGRRSITEDGLKAIEEGVRSGKVKEKT